MEFEQELYPESLDSYLDVAVEAEEIDEFVSNYAIEHRLILTVDNDSLLQCIINDRIQTCRQAIEKYVDLSAYV